MVITHNMHAQSYWSGLPFPPPRDILNPGIESVSPESPALAGGFFTIDPPGKPLFRPLTNLTHSLYLTLIHTPQMKAESTTKLTFLLDHVHWVLENTAVVH